MALSLKHSKALGDLAQILYEFLPGSGHPTWTGHVSFRTVAKKVGVEDFWQAGSKLPMITALLEKTFEHRRGKFEPLVVEVVRCGLAYRQKNNKPVTTSELDAINQAVLELGFKFPALWDPAFRKSLRNSSVSQPTQEKPSEQADRDEKRREAERAKRQNELDSLKQEFLALGSLGDRQQAGLQFEKLLNRLFALHGLSPRQPFRLIGEQIDGSFELDHEVYLLEARWRKVASSPADLYVFREKIEGKSKYTRGVFISIHGVSPDAPDAITRGKQPNFFVVDGYDVMMLLEDNIELSAFLRRRQRLLAEEGRVCVPYTDL